MIFLNDFFRSWARKREKWFETFGGTFKEEELHRYFDTAKSRVYVAGSSFSYYFRCFGKMQHALIGDKERGVKRASATSYK